MVLRFNLKIYLVAYHDHSATYWAIQLRLSHCESAWADVAISTQNTMREDILGGDSDGVTPVPIPNTVVKPVYGDGTAPERVWESSKPPG